MPEPPIDTPENADAVNTLRIGVMRLARRIRHQREDRSLGVAELSALGTLHRCGPMSPGELARKEHVQPPTMTRILALLQERGLVGVAQHPVDRRQKTATVTERAEEMIRATRSKDNAWLTRLASRLDDDEWARLRAAAPVLHKLAHMDPTPFPPVEGSSASSGGAPVTGEPVDAAVPPGSPRRPTPTAPPPPAPSTTSPPGPEGDDHIAPHM